MSDLDISDQIEVAKKKDFEANKKAKKINPESSNSL